MSLSVWGITTGVFGRAMGEDWKVCEFVGPPCASRTESHVGESALLDACLDGGGERTLDAIFPMV
jgi:hypothetical protein